MEHGNLRELALARMKDLGTECRDVRTREVGIQEIHHKVRPYEVSGKTGCDWCHVLNENKDRRLGVNKYRHI